MAHLAPDVQAGADGDGAPVVVARALRKSYSVTRPPRAVLRGVSLEVLSGEFVALMGPSGCGKSTLLHVLGGLERPDSGTVTVDGRALYDLGDDALSAFRRDRIGFVFQFFNLLPTLTAAENVALPLRLRNDASGWHRRDRVSEVQIRERVTALMTRLNLRGLQGHGPEEISGGEQQRVALARALAAAPALLLADEPTGNLDWAAGRDVMALLGKLCRSEHQTTLLVTHEARVAAHADRVLVMRDGEVVDEMRPDHGGGPGSPAAVASVVARLGPQDL